MSSVIDLCGTMFRRAKFRPTKGSVKLHLLLDHDGYLLFLWCHHRGQVAFRARGSGRCDLSQGKTLVFDRAIWTANGLLSLVKQGVHLVARLKENADYWWLRNARFRM